MVVVCCKDYTPIVVQLQEMGEFDCRPMRYQPDLALIDEYAVILWEEKQFLSKAQDAVMKLLVEFDRVCKKYHLRYFLICGSLIGAVRHHGMIPWDDDEDVANLIRGVYGLALGHRARIDYTTYKNEGLGTRFVIRCTSILGKMLPLRFIFSLYEKLRKWNDKKECDYYYELNGWTKLFIRSMMGNCLEKGFISM